MTLIELMAIVGGTAGASFGAAAGYETVGLLGALAGGGAGFLGGLLFFPVMIGVAAGCADLVDRTLRRRRLSPRFPGYLGSQVEDAWGILQDSIRPGDEVTGVVVERRQGEVYADLGVGFPARLTRLNIVDGYGGDDPGAPWAELPEVGEALTARVLGYDRRDREVELTQRTTAWLEFEGEALGQLFMPEPQELGRVAYISSDREVDAAFWVRLKALGEAECTVIADGARTRRRIRFDGSDALELLAAEEGAPALPVAQQAG